LSPNIISELAPRGVLRAGINLSNFLLVTKINSTGYPKGVAPDLAHEVAMRLGVPVKYVPFKSSGELADAADKDIWDIGLIGALVRTVPNSVAQRFCLVSNSASAEQCQSRIYSH
jgi:polar amino acid transport system substrate-binding protein